MSTVLRLTGVSKRFREGDRERVVLDGVNLEVARGEFVALLGPSGSGKSTLLHLMSGMEAPDAGEIWVGSHLLTAMTERDRTLFRGRRLGFVFQFFNLIPTLTVMENVLLPLELRGAVGEEERDRAHALLTRVHLADRGESWPDRLSGGEQQRVAVARALVHDPEIVFADEPTGNLDARTGTLVLDLLVELLRDRGMTLFAVTHSNEVAARMDRVLRLADGRVVEDLP